MKPLFACLILGLGATLARAQGPLVTTTPTAADFALVRAGRAAPVLVEAQTEPAVARAVEDFRADIQRVTGVLPAKADPAAALPRELVLVGIVGQSPLLDRLAAANKIDLRALTGAWESFVIQVVAAPLPGVDRMLVVAGSDRRGAIYGAYEISQGIGVSPWHWWADVAPARREELFIAAGARRFGPPSVKYRGIFINDEDWGLQPWAARTHEPENGDIGPKTYARMFELLLRLKANLVWPGMHPSTKPFNAFPDNKRVADAYGIVMGSSHAEPMLRNNVGEWKGPASAYNYIANRDGVLGYWEQRMKENGQFDNVYTLGMRGIHDSNMVGPRTDPERIAALERIFADQRTLLRQYARGGEAAPQMFCAYKEVLDLYRKGLKVPDDVTIVWPDDNFGYIRNFANATERQRSGGFGVYYHISYLGRPLAYLWLNTTPPGLIWEEMHKAYEHGADRMWIVNVGDLKPSEATTEFFLQMAWDIKRWNAGNLDRFLPEWAAREFGPAQAKAIAGVLTEYYRLNFIRKPEHLQWWLPGEAVRESPFTREQAAERLADFRKISQQVLDLERAIPAANRDAFFELVKYPVLGSASANERFFHAEAYARLFNTNFPAARQHAAFARVADDRLRTLTHHYNEEIGGGKWRHLISLEPADNQWRGMRISPTIIPAASLAAPTADLAALPFGPAPSGAAARRPVTTVQIDPVKFATNTAASGAAWTPLAGFARTGGTLAVLPTTVSTVEPGAGAAPTVEYAATIPSAGKYRVVLRTLPTHPIVGERLSRIAVSLGDQPAQVLTTGSRDGSPEWAQGVLNNSVAASATFDVPTAGATRVRLQMVDPGIVLEAISVESLEMTTAAAESH